MKISGVAGRYAQALFDLAAQDAAVESLGSELGALARAISESPELARVLKSPLHDAAAQTAALDAIMDRLGFSALTRNFVHLVARNRRLAHLAEMIAAFQAMAAAARGEVQVQVTSASPLTATQQKKVTQALKAALGSDVRIENEIDPSILGGLIVRAGSRMVDTSVKTRLNTLKSILKGAR